MAKHQIFRLLCCSIFFLLSILLTQSQDTVYELDPLHVTGDLLNSPIDRMPSSLTLLQAGDAAAAGNRHFEDLTGRIPNLNWAGGTSRPRFFQIRGIGENSQFGNEIPASSVGFIIDGIDFTGIGTVAGLFDISRVEVLRGPQAAAFGANAMAGMIIIETAPPGPATESLFESTLGSYDLLSFGVATGGSIVSGNLDYRISLGNYQDNGFRDNTFLGRDDTNERNEWSSHLKLEYSLSPRLSVKLNLMYFDFDNGYDAWALDNDSFHTTTDEPGQDSQQTAALGTVVTLRMSEHSSIQYTVSVTDSEMIYSYDWDWSNPDELRELYGEEVYWGTDVTERARDVWSHDLRIVSDQERSSSRTGAEWVAGLYYREFQEEQAYFGILSDYGTATTALYGQSRFTLDQQFAITVAARIESHEIDYSSMPSGTADSPVANQLGDKETFRGGKLAVEYTPSERHLLYLSVDRGFKAGGVNLDDEVPMDFRVYGGENLLNYELGWRGLFRDNSLNVTACVFYMDRRDIQVDSSIQLGDGNTFALYKDNAASGENYGAEFEASWQINDNLNLFATAGLLRAVFDEYSYVDPADSSSIINLDGREQAYAPGYTYSAGMRYRLPGGLYFGAVIEGKDDYLFDLLSGSSLDGYNLLHLNAGYEWSGWNFNLWVKNALDERYDVRGFYFANEPPYYDMPRKWVSQGQPRQFGITARTRF